MTEHLQLLTSRAWYEWLAYFFCYAFFGWCFESAYVSIRQRKLVNRGFLRLPILPIYGSGAVMMLWASLPFRGNWLLTALSGAVGATLLELVTGWGMEKLFRMRYWDYSDQRFNFHGYICLSSTVVWSLFTVLLTEFWQPALQRGLDHIAPSVLVRAVIVGAALTAADTIASSKQAWELGKNLEQIARLREQVEKLKSQADQLRAQAEQLRSQAEQVKSDLEAELTERRDELREGIRSESRRRLEQAAQGLEEGRTRLEQLRERVRYQHLRRDFFGFYRRHQILGNPSMKAGEFSPALEELRRIIENRKD